MKSYMKKNNNQRLERFWSYRISIKCLHLYFEWLKSMALLCLQRVFTCCLFVCFRTSLVSLLFLYSTFIFSYTCIEKHCTYLVQLSMQPAGKCPKKKLECEMMDLIHTRLGSIFNVLLFLLSGRPLWGQRLVYGVNHPCGNQFIGYHGNRPGE